MWSSSLASAYYVIELIEKSGCARRSYCLRGRGAIQCGALCLSVYQINCVMFFCITANAHHGYSGVILRQNDSNSGNYSACFYGGVRCLLPVSVTVSCIMYKTLRQFNCIKWHIIYRVCNNLFRITSPWRLAVPCQTHSPAALVMTILRNARPEDVRYQLISTLAFRATYLVNSEQWSSSEVELPRRKMPHIGARRARQRNPRQIKKNTLYSWLLSRP